MSSLWLLLGLCASCGALPLRAGGERRLQYAMDDTSIRTAVTAWFDDAAAAEVTYGHISTWETGGVTDMSYLFCGSAIDYSYAGYCDTAAASGRVPTLCPVINKKRSRAKAKLR